MTINMLLMDIIITIIFINFYFKIRKKNFLNIYHGLFHPHEWPI